jgi:hypothetical protein
LLTVLVSLPGTGWKLKTIERLMKKHLIPLSMLFAPLFCFAQVGIGTTTPNVKSVLDLTSSSQGLLVPRMTGLQRSQMTLAADDLGMMVYQTDLALPPLPSTPKGLYYFDGANWIAPIPNGASIGQTLRWDGNKWTATSNLFNQGSSLGVGTVNPKNQLHIHSALTPEIRLQITNANTGAQAGDGFVIGNYQSNSHAHVLQLENKPLWFGTNGAERMRIDSAGNIGIGKTNPSATLDVNGTVRIGATGSILHSILKQTVEVEIPPLDYGAEGMVDIPFSNSLVDASVYVSPGSTMSGLIIAYARVSSPGHIEVKFMNMSPDMDGPMTLTLHVSVIQ